MFTLIENCRLISPDVEIAEASILIENEKIIQVAPGKISAPAGCRVIDAAGLTAVPGFIDLHCHGRNSFDFCDGSAEGAKAIAENKLAEGVTTLLPTTLTVSEADLADSLAAVAAYDQKTGCRIPGVHLEGPFINVKAAGAQNPAFVRVPDAAEVDRLNKVFPVKKITFAIEEAKGIEFVGEMLKRGIVPSCTHSQAKYEVFKMAHDAGLRNLSHFCNQMTPLHHRDIGLVGAGLLHKDVFAELICDKLHISPAMIQLVFSVKGADKVILISDAMRASGMPDGEYDLGGLPVMVADGAARLKEGGALAGSTLQLATAFKNICEVTGMPEKELIKATSASAAAAMGWLDRGALMPGYLADIVLLDSDYTVQKTFVGGDLRFEK
ncbi:MAG: N-acetylglucosamine-6-phosphate deacetylase [Lentisphaeria bacterium]|nr:N-acetylglucosamine-6-phosphate deacetylase [Lentisphaeria bacterium]